MTSKALRSSPPSLTGDLSALQVVLLDRIKDNLCFVNDLERVACAPVAEVQEALLGLQLRGQVVAIQVRAVKS
jgi:predicted Rossmann fold nucleotide-binding protein DprA/Smf involved in DNA uptake